MYQVDLVYSQQIDVAVFLERFGPKAAALHTPACVCAGWLICLWPSCRAILKDAPCAATTRQ